MQAKEKGRERIPPQRLRTHLTGQQGPKRKAQRRHLTSVQKD
jgi:hypothetical protein